MENIKPTITIGVPAHNEEQNISNLIYSLLKQKIEKGILEKIIVVSDGSTDKTSERVRAINNEKLEFIELPERKGKYFVQNYLSSHVESDILVVLDADILPENEHSIDNLIYPIIRDEKVGLTAANSVPAKSRTFFEKVLANSHQMKKELALKINKENNIYLCSGLARAFRKEFYKKLAWISEAPEDAFSYTKCVELGFKFKFVKDAKIIFRLPSNFKDHARQSKRFFGGTKAIEKEVLINNPYKIPFWAGFSTMSKFMFTHPVLTSIYVLVVIYIRCLSRDKAFSSDWEVASSTKTNQYDNNLFTPDKKLSVSVGIPAYNEENNIAQLIKSILAQRETNFSLKEILVFSDGSTDKTTDKANLGDVRIKIFNDGNREGKTVRENEMIKEMTGDILLIFDADIAITDDGYLEKMVMPFYIHPNTGIVGGRAFPLPPKNLFEKIMNFSALFKDDVYRQIKNGNNLYFCHGRNRAFSADFLKDFTWPKIASEDAFSYLSSIKRGFLFVSPEEAKIFYRLPHNMRDHLKQSTRFFKSKKLLVRWFDKKLMDEEYGIKKIYMIRSAVKYFFKNPFYFSAYIVILVIANIKTLFQSQPDHKWDISVSSKKLD